VLLVDADPQASVTKWFDLTVEDLPFDCTQLTTARVLYQQIPRLRQSYDLIVVDCPPMQTDVTAAAVTQADLGLVPLLRQAQGVNATLTLRFVINQLPPRTTLAREMQDTLVDADIPVLPTYIHDRQVYRRCVALGATVLSESRPARDDLLALKKDVVHALKITA